MGAEAPSLLAGLLYDRDGDRLTPTHAVKKGKRYRYYVSTALITGDRSEHPNGRRIPAGDIEGLTLDRLRALFASGKEIGDAVAPLGLDASTQQALLERSTLLAQRWISLSSLELRELVHCVVQRIEVGDAQISIQLDRMAIVSRLMPKTARKSTVRMPAVDCLILSIAANLRRAGKGVRLVIGDGAANAVDDGLAALIARAMATRDMFLSGGDDSIDAMAARLGVRRDHLAVLVRLSYLAPEIVRAILAGQQPRRADADAARRAVQKPAARLAGAAAGSGLSAELKARPTQPSRSTSDGSKTGHRDTCPVGAPQGLDFRLWRPAAATPARQAADMSEEFRRTRKLIRYCKMVQLAGCARSPAANSSPHANSLLTGKITGNFEKIGRFPEK